MRNVNTLKGQNALSAFQQAAFDLETLEPEVGELMRDGTQDQAQTILALHVILQRVLLKLVVQTRGKIERGNFHGR